MKIFDSFRFFNELEILEIRFNILYNYFIETSASEAVSSKYK